MGGLVPASAGQRGKACADCGLADCGVSIVVLSGGFLGLLVAGFGSGSENDAVSARSRPTWSSVRGTSAAHWEAPLQAHWEAPPQAHWEAPLQAHWEAPQQAYWEAPQQAHWELLLQPQNT